MKRTNEHSFIQLHNGSSDFLFTANGDILEWMHDSVMINAFRGNLLDGSPGNLYLRIYQEKGITSYPLLGSMSSGTVSSTAHSLIYKGSVDAVTYTVTLRLTPYGIWFWDILLDGSCEKADLIFTQDIGAASKGSVDTNELYTAQYLDHSIFQCENGYCICSRQNMSQNGRHPYLQLGSHGISTVSYATDGTQFYGLSYKKTNIPEALACDLPAINKQYELSQISLQTETFPLSGTKKCSFYGICRADHPDEVKEREFGDELKQALLWKDDTASKPVPPKSVAKCIGAPYSSPVWSEAQINTFFPERKLEEFRNDTLYSFFTPQDSHVVLQEKELDTERPHGHILLENFDSTKIPQGLISSTNYMYGVFNAQLVVGNTNMNKLLSNHKGLLNIAKVSGQRLYVKRNQKYQILTLPSAYEMDISGSTWYYQLDDDVLIITSFAVYDRPEIALQVQSKLNRNYEFIITNQIAEDENGPLFYTEQSERILTFLPAEANHSHTEYPGLKFRFLLPENSIVSDDSFFFDDKIACNASSFVTIRVSECSKFSLIMQGTTSGDSQSFLTNYDYKEQKPAFRHYYEAMSSHFHLTGGRDNQLLSEKLNATLLWYTHDALIHFASPHGLEQSSGAAWGTRDICQGPFEFFMSTQHYPLVKNILLTLFSHQIISTMEWPQWFMFDRYSMHQEDCHGDIVFWPLKALGDYLLATGDTAILDIPLDYRLADGSKACQPDSLFAHVKCAVDAITQRFLPGTFLISYAGGDWDDTLQPANKHLKEHLVSAWTQALAAQTLTILAQALANYDMDVSQNVQDMATGIIADFHKYLVKDDVIAGFLYLDPDGTRKYMLHPLDVETSIHYRLLPMTRSIIARLSSPALAANSLKLIDMHLSCPDGIRLMDHPAGYTGGNSHIFLRAEQASNIGREISLQYVHAHIRYVEAMAVYGDSSRVLDGLLRINPILLSDYVKNALPRQSNVYFSSSDGCYNDRYDYAANFKLLRTGDIPVKGGWRLYSSGPGIYFSRVAADMFGIRFDNDNIILDPVLPSAFDGFTLTYDCYGKTVQFVYHVDTAQKDSLKVEISGQSYGTARFNPYRAGGVSIEKNTFINALTSDNVVDIYMNCK